MPIRSLAPLLKGTPGPGTDAPIPIRVDLEESIDGETTVGDITLQAFDVVYVPKSWIANANLFVQQYIKDLILFRGWGLGGVSIP